MSDAPATWKSKAARRPRKLAAFSGVIRIRRTATAIAFMISQGHKEVTRMGVFCAACCKRCSDEGVASSSQAPRHASGNVENKCFDQSIPVSNVRVLAQGHFLGSVERYALAKFTDELAGFTSPRLFLCSGQICVRRNVCRSISSRLAKLPALSRDRRSLRHRCILLHFDLNAAVVRGVLRNRTE